MKKLFLLTTCIVFCSLISIAQIERKVDTSHILQSNSSQKNNKKEMLKELNLSKEQMGQLKEFRHYMQQQKESINDDPSLTDADKKAKLKDLRMHQKNKLNSILTPVQKTKLVELKKNGMLQQQE